MLDDVVGAKIPGQSNLKTPVPKYPWHFSMEEEPGGKYLKWWGRIGTTVSYLSTLWGGPWWQARIWGSSYPNSQCCHTWSRAKVKFTGFLTFFGSGLWIAMKLVFLPITGSLFRFLFCNKHLKCHIQQIFLRDLRINI